MAKDILISLLAVIIISLSFLTSATAAHIVGGDITYRFLSFNADSTQVTFEINVTMYRDNLSGGAIFDSGMDAFFGIHREISPDNWILENQVTGINPTTPEEIIANDDPCVDEPQGVVGVEKASYIFNVTLDVVEDNYMISYQRCCRNESISNLIMPGETGAAFDVIISPEAQRLGNSSPVFKEFPPIFICAGFPVSVDQSAGDFNGDRLVYSFCTPFTAGGTFDSNTQQGGDLRCCECVRPAPGLCLPPFETVQFRAPFTPLGPLGGNPVVTIDSNTGIITGIPESTGQFVVGVCVEEFRNGVSLGKIRRDFQFNVLQCEKEVSAIIDADERLDDASNTFVINSCGDTTLTLKNLSTEERFIQSYDWEFYREDQLIFEQSGGAAQKDAEVVFPGVGTYEGFMIVNKGIDCADSAYFLINMFPDISADYMFDYDTCVAGPVSFVDGSSTRGDRLVGWEWDFGDGEFSSLPDPDHQFAVPGLRDVSLIVEDNNECKDTMTQQVAYFPAPSVIVVEPSNFIGCTPSEITLTNLSSPIDSTYDILWDLGDGNFSTEISPTHKYLEAGEYSISLDIVSPIGCGISRSYGEWIRIKESPDANFDCFPDELNIINRTASFTDLTDQAGAWLWDFGGEATSFIQNPTYTFQDTGIYKVLLTAYHPITNCPDTISKIIDVKPNVTFHYPNAFTPNGDSSNDLFLGTGYYDGLVNYNMTIWNRWGQLIFETDDPREGWNGQEFNTGTASPQGVYVYKAKFSDPRGNDFLEEGHITLLR